MKLFRLKERNYTNQKFNGSALLLVALVLTCFAISPMAEAVVPAPDGGYPGGNTAEGQNALFSLTNGMYNTAVGYLSLSSNTTGQLNTATGAGTLLANTADKNTATGAVALISNTIGGANTANGAFALFSNTTGNSNTAIGDSALFGNTSGSSNTAVGDQALHHNTTGFGNTAMGAGALFNNTIGSGNTAIGDGSGLDQTTGSNNIYVGSGIGGSAGESNACYIGSIFGQISPSGIPVFINSNNKLGTVTSSKRFKEDIKPLDKASEALFALKPVTFRYKKEIDPAGTSQFGLVAEDVEKVNPDLLVRDKEGKPYTVRYDAVNAMLLNEFLKEHREVAELKSTVAEQRKGMEKMATQLKEQAAQIQKVSAQLDVSRCSPRTALND
jgi:trimeric autotransporter adhesin